MKFLCLFLILTAPLLPAAEYELWILAGQSNAQGWKGDACRYPPGDPATDRTIPFYYASPGIGSCGDHWIGLGPQHGLYKRGHFGPEITFARSLAAAGHRVAIFKFALGGSSLERRWKGPGQDGLYDDMLAELHKARLGLRRDGQRSRIAGLIWIQGESDAMDPAASAHYEENLQRLLGHFRTKVAGNPHLPVILGVDEQHPLVQRRPIIVSAQQKLAADDPDITFVSMRGLPKADKSHLKPKGLAAHGRRLARAAIELAPADSPLP